MDKIVLPVGVLKKQLNPIKLIHNMEIQFSKFEKDMKLKIVTNSS